MDGKASKTVYLPVHPVYLADIMNGPKLAVFDLMWTEFACCRTLVDRCSPSLARERATPSSTKVSSFRL